MHSLEPVFRYLTHPQVHIDPKIPIPSWELSDLGRSRVDSLAQSGWLGGTKHIIASIEAKATQTGKILATSLGIGVSVRPGMHENDRSATGFLQPKEFEATANQFFEHPTKSVRGWETAVRAQVRIVTAVEAALSDIHGDGDVLFVGHGAVGTLLYCHYARLAISRKHDQPTGGGSYFSVRLKGREVLHSWRAMEIAPPPQ
jgi:broad specificity phosphatase PhoE